MDVILQISTAQGPAECRIFARFVLKRLLGDAAAAGVRAELLSETSDRHGPFSAVLKLAGAAAGELAQCWLGTLQWVCTSPLRPRHPRKNWYIGVFCLPPAPELPQEGEIVFKTCRAGGKGGQHVNKTESAVQATHLASGISVRVEDGRSQHANKKRALELIALKLAEQHAGAADSYARSQHAQLYRVERGGARRTFAGTDFKEGR